ncbi:MAG: winged helix-turn-helix domain-containing protein [Saccharolobus sp.]|jgi:predicted transcriptional regulator|uniref:winged helix-turn-helix domain-containing protein n=1 Tax=Saccharolobus sp. TaxID=2100761 RepID=UPI0028CBD2E1|nr:winged helix-turn-helix domain-containing protein [Saccharolobus sp.]MDT7862202.1 winged helix-turn-helix domain-containing protein [Saccharolobus sp.]
MRRNKEEIIADILEAIDNKINRISSIMKNVNLSASLAKKYLKILMENGLIEEKNGEYILTESGRKVLEQIRDLRKLEVELALILNDLRKEIKIDQSE